MKFSRDNSYFKYPRVYSNQAKHQIKHLVIQLQNDKARQMVGIFNVAISNIANSKDSLVSGQEKWVSSQEKASGGLAVLQWNIGKRLKK